MKQIIILIILTFSIQLGFAQSPSVAGVGEADSATMYLTGTFKKYNPQRAFQINLQNANNGNAKAMNAVAIQYMKGLGIDSNFNLAVYWFNQAATNGYTKALVNLGMLYKHQAADSLSYSIACNYFNQALQASEPSAYFAQGYMFYKGLGCNQSYTSALALFNQGIAHNQSNCMYFKGLCYKFGYGVAANADSANYYIDTAAKLGYKQANAELYNNNQNATAARTSSSLRGTKQSQTNEKQKTRNGIEKITRNETFISIPKTNNTIKLNGEFTGEMLQYDYSGKKLIAQIPINLQVSTANNIINGILKFNNSQAIELNAIQQGNQLIFSQTAVIAKNEAVIAKNEAISKQKTRNEKLIFKSATLNIETSHNPLLGGRGSDTNFLTGSLVLFNTYTHETHKPINIKLVQRNEEQETKNRDNEKQETRNVVVYPNPTKGTFNISFTLTKPSPVKINIYNQQGQVVYTKIIDELKQGKQTISTNAPLSVGIYTVSLLSNQQQQTTAFIKE